MQSGLVLQELREITEQIILDCEPFRKLDERSFNQRPAEKKWSIAECLEHLCLYGDFYLPAIDAKFSKASPKIKDEFKSGLLGNYFAQSMKVRSGQIGKPMSTFKDKNPSLLEKQAPKNSLYSQIEKDPQLSRFLEQQNQFLSLINKAASVDLNKNKVAITLSRFIRLKMGDVLLFNVYHNERHLLQAKNVLRKIRE